MRITSADAAESRPAATDRAPRGPRGHRGPRSHRGPGPGLAIVTGLIQVLGARGGAADQPAATALDAFGYALLVVGPAALVLRRRAPVAVLAVTAAATVAYQVLGYPSGPVFVALIVALFGAATRGHRYPTGAIMAIGYLGYLYLGRLVPAVGGRELHVPTVGRALLVGLGVVIVFVLAEASRVRREHYAQVTQFRAERARARAEQARRQASEERLRMAQELHDVLGHHLSLISVQAGVGLHLMDSRPDQARAALAAIKSASAEALREVRSVLGVLRADDEIAPRSPAPGLDNLAGLTVDGGIRVHTSTNGTPRTLPPEVDRAAYRIVQEALTNVRRHAGPGASAAVTIEYADDEVRVRVDDDGRGDQPDGALADGNGIPGMRARAGALGGSLTARPAPGGGFRVEARLPTQGSP